MTALPGGAAAYAWSEYRDATYRVVVRRRDADGVLVPSPPQVRITARGVERLRVRLGVLTLTN